MSTKKINSNPTFPPLWLFLWVGMVLCCFVIALLDSTFQERLLKTRLFRQARVLAESLHESDPEVLKKHHSDMSESEVSTVETKLSIFQEYLREFFPGANVVLLEICGETNRLDVIQAEHVDGTSIANHTPHWKESILNGSYGTRKFNRSLSVIYPLYMMDSECVEMATCIYFPETPLASFLQKDPLRQALLFAGGYSFIIILAGLLLLLRKKKSGEEIKTRRAVGFSITLFLCGSLLSTQLANLAGKHQRADRLDTFNVFTSPILSKLSNSFLEIERHILSQTAALMRMNEEISESEFQEFSPELLPYQDKSTLFWITENQDSFPEVTFRTDGISNLIPLDDPQEFHQVLVKSKATGEARASRIHTSELNKSPSIFAAHAVEKSGRLLGWIGCTLVLRDMIQDSRRYGNFDPDRVKLDLLELTRPYIPLLERLSPLSFSRPVFVFGRSYLISVSPTSLFWEKAPLRTASWVWMAGAALSLILSIMAFQTMLRGQRLDDKVRDRTRTLDQLLSKHKTIISNLPLGLALYENHAFVEKNQKLSSWFAKDEDLCAQLKPLIEESAEQGAKFKEIVTLQTQFGEKQMQCTALPVSEPSSEKKRILILLEDWTDQLRSEKELKDKTMELERLFNSSTDLLCTSALDGTLLNLNPQWKKTLGYTSSEMTGRKWIDYVHEEDREQARTYLQKLCEGELNQNFTIRFTHREGEIIWLEWKATCEGNLMHSNVRDITERKKADEKNRNLREHVARAQRMESIGRLAGGIAHDFNNSLQVIIGNTQLMLIQPGVPFKQKDQLNEILKAADRSSLLTKQLLGFAMKQHVQPDPTHLNRKLHGMEPMFKTVVGDRIQLVWDLDPDLADVSMDNSQLEQICISLLENSRDAMHQGGRITIKTENRDYSHEMPEDLMVSLSPGHYVCFSVQDTGTGIADNLRGTLFEPFTTSQDPSKGSGLGLATVYGILQQNGGSIRVQSQVGIGTLMEVILPRLSDVETPPLCPEPSSGEEGKILVVDDNPQVLQLSKLVLNELKFSAVPCSTASEALKVLEQDPTISLLLTDVLMPEISGQELYEKALRIRPNLKCIFMSGYTSDIVDSSHLVSGKCTFLLKPFSVDGVKEAIEELLPPG